MSFFANQSNALQLGPSTSSEPSASGVSFPSSVYSSSPMQTSTINSGALSVIHNSVRNTSVEVTNPSDDPASSLALSPSSLQHTYVIAGSWDPRVSGWEVQQPELQTWQKAPPNNSNQILDVVWSEDGTRVFTTAADKTVKVWDLASNQAMPVLDLKLLDEMDSECEAQALQQGHHDIEVRTEQRDSTEDLSVFRSTSSAPPIMNGCLSSLPQVHEEPIHSRHMDHHNLPPNSILVHTDSYTPNQIHSHIHHLNNHIFQSQDHSLSHHQVENDHTDHEANRDEEEVHQHENFNEVEVSQQPHGHHSTLTPLDPVPVDMNVVSTHHELLRPENPSNQESIIHSSYLEHVSFSKTYIEQVACDSTTDLLVPTENAPPSTTSVTSSLTTSGGHKLRDKIAKSQQQQLNSQNRMRRENSGDSQQKNKEDVSEDRRKPTSSGQTGIGQGPTQHKCDTCGKCFPRFYSLRRHQIMHSGEKKFKCPICNMSFSHVYNRNRHVKRHVNRSNPSLRRQPLSSNGRGNQENFPSTRDGMASSQRLPMTENLSKLTDPSIGAVSKDQTTGSPSSSSRPFRCNDCYKCFTTEERLVKHTAVHLSDDSHKPLACSFCDKRFLNNSALSCHLKIHSTPKDQPRKYDCVLCKKEFDCAQSRKEHVGSHADPITGRFSCNRCRKTFVEFTALRKHIRAFHSDRQYPCSVCQKVFPRPDKLKLHMLRHSDHREFLCQTCGKQFKRKDKLKEHMQRMHGPDREAKVAARAAARMALSTNAVVSNGHLVVSASSGSPSNHMSGKKFVPKVSPNDYHRFIYKCHTCLLGFKRRGMLVNHLAKRHPETPPEAVPELNLPILKTTRDYYCQYCDKIYKSSSKRKAHILKNHPGKALPLSNRQKGGIPCVPGHPNPTYSATVGSITTHPQYCNWCHKQYASKAKLLQHQRKKHSECLTSRNSSQDPSQVGQSPSSDQSGQVYAEDLTLTTASNVNIINNCHSPRERNDIGSQESTSQTVTSNIISILGSLGINASESAAAELQELLQTNPAAASDILTQAMSELSSSQSSTENLSHEGKDNNVISHHTSQHDSDLTWT